MAAGPEEAATPEPEVAVGSPEIPLAARVGFADAVSEPVAEAAVARLRAAGRARAVAEAELAAAAVGVADLCEDREHDSVQVAAVLAWSSRFAGVEVGWCRQLITQLPEVFAAWSAGWIDRCRARVFEDCLSSLILGGDTEVARMIAGHVMPQAPRWTPGRLRARLLRLVLAADPATAVKRAEATVANRDVWLGDGGDGATASLTAFNLPAGRAAAAFERVDAIARARRAGGDGRTLAQLRADTVLDLLDGTAAADLPAPVGRAGVVELQIPLASAIDAGTEPGELAGYGPVLADVARQIADHRRDAQWRFTVTYRGELVYQGLTKARPQAPAPMPATPTSTTSAAPAPAYPAAGARLRDWATGQPITAVDQHTSCPPVETDPGRRIPGEALKRWVASRDRTCRAPGCQMPARACQYDHTTDHADGGTTSHDNLALLCEHHHRAKHAGWWTITQPEPGRILWITPSGHTYRPPD